MISLLKSPRNTVYDHRGSYLTVWHESQFRSGRQPPRGPLWAIEKAWALQKHQVPPRRLAQAIQARRAAPDAFPSDATPIPYQANASAKLDPDKSFGPIHRYGPGSQSAQSLGCKEREGPQVSFETTNVAIQKDLQASWRLLWEYASIGSERSGRGVCCLGYKVTKENLR